ncbi:cytochrome P450 [Marinobacter halophilus]|uniref:Cytochrome P450 n=1 Tax=Marinobacter halophilus TaxID=1323740 RepID=A0A2T1KJF7_9GAMM|nr:cytochrome P450 [Marinobacter halophilus]PSF10274.1 cytochrome P450 [Marinobacter halophilus]GGC69343.1 putative cytochrome P450 [Marinobacter halophilus]
MNLLKPLLEPVIQPALDKATSVIPLHWQIRGAHAFQSLKQRAGKARPIPVFSEVPLPDVSTLALQDIDVSNPFLYRQGLWHSYFKRLRDECPVHFQKSSPFGPFWSVTRYEDIMFVDTHHDLFSAEPIITIGPQPEGLELETFIAMDPPKHDAQRQAVQGVVAPKNLAQMENLIRSRTADVLDRLPVNEPFDWVQNVSIDLTSRMLATLFDFPFEQRHKLAYWSDVAASPPEATGGSSNTAEAFDVAADIASNMSSLWRDKEARIAAGEEPGFDLISLLLANATTRTMINRPMEFMGNMALLIVGGNDTTRNSMTGGLWALNQFPDEFAKLKQNPGLIPNMVSEIIRWQTPLAYMRRVAKEDVTLNGQTINKGDKVVMWYASGNRDERAFEQDPDQFIIDRKNVRKHLSFGFGVHRCMGNRLAEMQLRILWEELLKRFDDIEVLDEPEYVQSNFVRGYTRMSVKLTAIT